MQSCVLTEVCKFGLGEPAKLKPKTLLLELKAEQKTFCYWDSKLCTPGTEIIIIGSERPTMNQIGKTKEQWFNFC